MIFMVVCECLLSKTTLNHINIVQKLLQENSQTLCKSDVVVLLLKYVLSETYVISLDDFTLIDQYFLEHPDFLHSFYNDVMISATFYLDQSEKV